MRSANVLREVFADNDEMLDLVTDEIVERFVELIRDVGREARFLEFLIVLCQSNGKAVRPNQWRVCRMLLQKHPELFFRLKLECGGGGTRDVLISADGRYFPAFRKVSELRLSEWLSMTEPSNAAYFAMSIELIALLVRGRNLRYKSIKYIRRRSSRSLSPAVEPQVICRGHGLSASARRPLRPSPFASVPATLQPSLPLGCPPQERRSCARGDAVRAHRSCDHFTFAQ